jgi:hypothetical protein
MHEPLSPIHRQELFLQRCSLTEHHSQRQIMVSCDVFDVQEKDDFLESEQQGRCPKIVEQLILDPLRGKREHLVEISLDMALEREQLVQLVDALIVQCEHHRLASLSFSHWGGLGDVGAKQVARLLESGVGLSLQSLSLTNCGITSVGIDSILKSLTTIQITSSLVKLDLSRNNLRQASITNRRQPQQLLLCEAFREYLPRIRHLKELHLAATSLDKTSVQALLTGLEGNSSVTTLDISENSNHHWDESPLETLLECILDHLPRLMMMGRLERLVLAKGASSSTCIDYETKSSGVLERLANTLLQQRCSSLYFLGPLAILPLDRQSCVETHGLYQRCVHHLETVQFCLERNRFQRLMVRSVMDRPSLLQTCLARASKRRNPSECASLQYSLLRETVSGWMISA